MASLKTSLALLAASASTVYGLLPVTGVQGDSYPRYEIRDLHLNHPQQWDLYIQAIQAFHNVDYSDTGSYYQISGIHGLPNVAWDGVTGDGGGTGYCTHSINIFPTWHRPYVALFEQQLQAQAVQIANTYPDSNKQQYIDAANQLRSPYLDWAINPAAGGNALPDEVAGVTVSVNTPSGQQTLYNPLYAFRFTTIPSDFPSPYSTWTDTLRYPNSGNPDAQSQEDQSVQAINQAQPGQKSGVFQMLTNCPDFMTISNDQNSGSNGCPISLESLHNNFHVQVGGAGNPAGHMTVVPVSGFEPTFMMHHTMVDRLFAMWQVLHPDSWITDAASGVSTYTIHQGDTIGGDSALTPFRDSNGNFWTSNNVRDVNTFHYTYPELQQANGDAGAMSGIVSNLYGDGSGTTAAKKSKRTIGQKFAKRQIGGLLKGLVAGNGSSWQYNANIATPKFALGGSYAINIFFQDPASSDPRAWTYDKNLVGSAGIFASQFMKGNSIISSSAVPLTASLSKLVQSGQLASLDPTDVVPFLTKNLQWRIVGPDGSEVNPADLKGLEIGVVSSTLAPLTSALQKITQPLWSSFNLLSDITKGKAGGVGA